MPTHALAHRRATARAQPRAGITPPSPAPATRAAIRQTLGGTALQAKLTVGPPNDIYEQEADRVADQVMRMPEPGAANAMASSVEPPHIQRVCKECEEEMRRAAVDEDEEKEIQRKESSAAVPTVDSALEARIRSLSGGGSPLPEPTRAFFEPRFGQDFSGVRVHTGPAASEVAGVLRAKAFTTGENIVFGRGQYEPGAGDGKKLLAHELTHVVQQQPGPRLLVASPWRFGSGTARPLRRQPATAPTPNPLPAAVPAVGPTDFQITRVGTSTQSRIFFSQGGATLNAAANTQINAVKAAAPGSVRLIGYASADEPAGVAQDRANAVRAALAAPPNPVTVASAVGNAAATESRSDFTAARSVEILVGSTAPSTVNCAEVDAAGNLVNSPKQPCPTMDPPTWTSFNDALVVANGAMTGADTALTGAPSPSVAAVVDRFFGNHTAAVLGTLRTNIGNLKAHVSSLPAITQCGGQCDAGGCAQGPIAYNSGVGPASPMTLCVPTFKSGHLNDRARTLIHESAHGTSPLGGTTGTGTRDVAYRHERMLFHLSPAERLRNSDSYALFAMFLREIQITGNTAAVPAGISTPASDTLTGFSTIGERPALELAFARLEKRLTWAKDWTGQLYGRILAVRTGTGTWAPASWASTLMAQAASRFPLTAPPATPTLTDQNRVAGLIDRYSRMKAAVRHDLTATPMAAGVLSWTPAPWVAAATLQVGPDFFRATPPDQVSLLLENLAGATTDVEAAFIPAYVSFAEWIHGQNP